MLVRTAARPVRQSQRTALRGGRAGTGEQPRLPESLRVKRQISVRGAIMIGGQQMQVGLTHAGKTADVTVETDTFRSWSSLALSSPRRPQALVKPCATRLPLRQDSVMDHRS
jgi:hypothetical protein